MLRNRIKIIAIAVLTALFISLGSYGAAFVNSKTVTIDTGRIAGTISGDVLSFKGIPYAMPPIGDLR